MGQERKHLLAARFSHFDPTQTSAAPVEDAVVAFAIVKKSGMASRSSCSLQCLVAAESDDLARMDDRNFPLLRTLYGEDISFTV
jgi:hypothetical protein